MKALLSNNSNNKANTHGKKKPNNTNAAQQQQQMGREGWESVETTTKWVVLPAAGSAELTHMVKRKKKGTVLLFFLGD
jgi:hypothetical protein